jgi:hypothetical protein
MSVDEAIRRLPPSDVAVLANGEVLVTYSSADHPETSVWRLYGRHDNPIADGRGATSVDPAGNGFLLPGQYVDAAGHVTTVDWEETFHRPVRPGDIGVNGAGVYRPSDHQLFNGTAQPDGVVSAVDHQGRLWALGRTHKRTIVRRATPGQPWASRDLGPGISAHDIEAIGTLLLIVGQRQLYISADDGNTWTLVTHHASSYGGGPPDIYVRPDGSIVAGDERAGYTISHDHRTFTPAPLDVLQQNAQIRPLGDLWARGSGSSLEISTDQHHWLPFSVATVRSLLANTSR